MKKLLIMLVVLSIPSVLLGQSGKVGSRGIFGTDTAPSVNDSLVGSAAADTTNSRVMWYPRGLKGNFTLAVDVTENSGSITSTTVQYRLYFRRFTSASPPADVYSNWFTLGTITADNAYMELFDLTANVNWLYNQGVQLRFLAASGTFNIDLDARLFWQ